MRLGSIRRGSRGEKSIVERTFGSARIANAFLTPNHSLDRWRVSMVSRPRIVSAQRSISRSPVCSRIRSAASSALRGLTDHS